MRAYKGVPLRCVDDPLVRISLANLDTYSRQTGRAFSKSIAKGPTPLALITPTVSPTSGGSGGTTGDYIDAAWAIADNLTPSKRAQFKCDLISPSTTRIFSFPNTTGTLALTSDIATLAAPIGAKYIVQTLDPSLTNEQSLGALTTGILLNTVTASTGVLSTAAGTDLPTGIPESKLSNDSLLARVADTESISGLWTFSSDLHFATDVRAIVWDGSGSSISMTPGSTRGWLFPDHDGTVSVRPGTVNATGQTGNIGTTNIVTTPGVDMYAVHVWLAVTTAGGADRTITVTLGWTDEVGATTSNVINVFAANTQGRTSVTQVLYLASGSPTYATTLAGVAGGAPTYNLRIRAIAL